MTISEMVGYARVHEVLCNAYEQNNYRALTELQTRRAIQTGTGYSFPAGTRIEDILNGLEQCELIVKGIFHGSDKLKVIPLKFP